MNNELCKKELCVIFFYSTFYNVYTSLDPIEWNGGIINEQLLKRYVEGSGWSDFKHCSSIHLKALSKNT
jgi:hypothetical protein